MSMNSFTLRFLLVFIICVAILGCDDASDEPNPITPPPSTARPVNPYLQTNIKIYSGNKNEITNQIDHTNTSNANTNNTNTNNTMNTNDRLAPTLQLAMRDRIAWPVTLLTVKGVANDDSGTVYVTVDGTSADIDLNGKFEVDVFLRPGSNRIIVRAADIAGNMSTQEVDVYNGYRLSIGNSQAVMIRENIIRTWGRNELGQLGNGTLDPSGYGDQPDTSSFPATYDRRMPGMLSVVTRQTFMVALRNDGTVWTWGDNELGQLGYQAMDTCGRSGDIPCQRIPAQVPSIYNAVGIAAGYNHTLILLENGRVLSFGDNAYGQLGRTTDQTFTYTPVMIEGLESVVQVAAGIEMSYALTASGDLYAFGANDTGQLGLGQIDENIHLDPRLVDIDPVAMVAAANRTGIALMRDGTVQSWGQNHKGQAGNGTYMDHVLFPTQILTNTGILSEATYVFGDGFVSGVLTVDGRVYMCGLGALGQLGQGMLPDGERDLDDRFIASEVAIAQIDRPFFDIIEADVGAGGPALALSRDGDLYGWGWSFRGSLGLTGAIDAWAYSSPVLIFPAD